jgi:ferric-dicitrate binding protein FerR (iron transport regulator)
MRTMLCLIAVSWSHPVLAVEAIGEVGILAGKCFSRAGNSVAAKGVPVLLDDAALTGDESRLDLQLGRSIRINASLKIDRFIAGHNDTLTLDRGVVERWKGADPKFEVKTPYALLAARGTEFFAGPSKGLFGVFVKLGIVEVKARQATVSLNAGQCTDFKEPGDPPSPPKLWAPGA